MHAHPDLLPQNGGPWLLRVGIGSKFSRAPHKLVLPGGAGVVAPKAFEIDCANVTSSAISSEEAVNLLEVL